MARRKSRLNKRAIMESRRRRRSRGIRVTAFNGFDDEDIIESDVAKSITSALWSNNVSKLTNFYTSSTQVAAESGKYQWEIYGEDPGANASASVQFSVAYGHIYGSASATSSGASSVDKTPSKAVYTAFANQLLAPGDDQFTINGTNLNHAYFISVNRERFKEKMNPNGWQLNLWMGGTDMIHLIDDSRYNSEASVNGSRVYNVISGSLSAGQDTVNKNNFGLFYPDLGILVLDNKYMSDVVGELGDQTPDNMSLTGAATTSQPKAFFEALDKATYGDHFQGRAEEDISSTHYFVRVKNSEYNFSNNPTFTNTVGQLSNANMVGDPTSFITTVGLYNDENELVATAKLSKPLAKTFSREATIRVKLDY